MANETQSMQNISAGDANRNDTANNTVITQKVRDLLNLSYPAVKHLREIGVLQAFQISTLAGKPVYAYDRSNVKHVKDALESARRLVSEKMVDPINGQLWIIEVTMDENDNPSYGIVNVEKRKPGGICSREYANENYGYSTRKSKTDELERILVYGDSSGPEGYRIALYKSDLKDYQNKQKPTNYDDEKWLTVRELARAIAKKKKISGKGNFTKLLLEVYEQALHWQTLRWLKSKEVKRAEKTKSRQGTFGKAIRDRTVYSKRGFFQLWDADPKPYIEKVKTLLREAGPEGMPCDELKEILKGKKGDVIADLVGIIGARFARIVGDAGAAPENDRPGRNLPVYILRHPGPRPAQNHRPRLEIDCLLEKELEVNGPCLKVALVDKWNIDPGVLREAFYRLVAKLAKVDSKAQNPGEASGHDAGRVVEAASPDDADAQAFIAKLKEMRHYVRAYRKDGKILGAAWAFFCLPGQTIDREKCRRVIAEYQQNKANAGNLDDDDYDPEVGDCDLETSGEQMSTAQTSQLDAVKELLERIKNDSSSAIDALEDTGTRQGQSATDRYATHQPLPAVEQPTHDPKPAADQQRIGSDWESDATGKRATDGTGKYPGHTKKAYKTGRRPAPEREPVLEFCYDEFVINKKSRSDVLDAAQRLFGPSAPKTKDALKDFVWQWAHRFDPPLKTNSREGG